MVENKQINKNNNQNDFLFKWNIIKNGLFTVWLMVTLSIYLYSDFKHPISLLGYMGVWVLALVADAIVSSAYTIKER